VLCIPGPMIAWLSLPLAAAAPIEAGDGPLLLAEEVTVLRSVAFDFQENFGAAIALEGDRMAVGAPRGETGIAGPSVLVFERTGEAWNLTAELFPTGTLGFSEFGAAVALDGDRLLVGAPQTFLGGPHRGSGAAYLFELAGGVWAEVERLEPVPEINEVEFGCAVALEGDVAVVGACMDDLVALRAGAAYVFRKAGTTWAMEDRLVANDLEANWEFGNALALEGDTLVVGAWRAEYTAQRGAAYVFSYDGSGWSQAARLQGSDTTFNDFFGVALALKGTTLAIGAWGHDGPGGPSSGALYVFEGAGTAWTEVQKLEPAGLGFQTRFGESLALGDGRLVGGGYNHKNDGIRTGAAWAYERQGSVWTEAAYLWSPEADVDAELGKDVALDGDDVATGMTEDEERGGVVVWRLRAPAPGQPLCPGDGSGSSCPCGNEAVTPGAGCAHSGGDGIRLEAWGSTSVAAYDLMFLARACPPGNSGIFYCGRTSVAPGTLLFDGLQCAGGDVRRFQGLFQTSGCATDTGFVAQDPTGDYFVPGVQAVFQYWTRDVATGASPCGTFRTFSNAWALVWSP